ncbi:hypothetical protein U1740_08915 [Aeromonas caviae]|uniref:hypothetical protein n=1 Tax=Aeromonas caviae TaxID=648 RepID=UPI0030157F93
MPVSALGDADPLVEVEAAVVGAVGDEHHLMATAIGENDEITGLCRNAVQISTFLTDYS